MALIKLNATQGLTGTLPAVSGANLTNIDGGKVLSVNINPNNTLSQASNNSTTYADVNGVDLVITPASTSSKFVLYTNFSFDTGGNTQGIRSRLTYNHSGISQTNVDSAHEDFGNRVSGGGRLVAFTSSHYYLAPSTTNEITFRLQFSNQGSGTVYLNRKNLRITAWEYA